MAENYKQRIQNIQRNEEEALAKQKAAQLQMSYLNLSSIPVQNTAVLKIDEEIAKKARAAGIKIVKSTIGLAVADPSNPATQALIETLKNKFENVGLFLVSQSSLQDAWSHYNTKHPDSTAKSEKETGTPIGDFDEFQKDVSSIQDVSGVLEKISKTDASRAFEAIFGAALTLNATDIHVEPLKDSTTIRFRVDGVLYEVAHIDDHMYGLLLSRVKLLSKLKLNVHDKPQEGSFPLVFENRDIEVRTSVLPSEYKEEVALRILDSKFLLSLEELGLRKDLFEKLKHSLSEPQGLILATGPTGSGKTTTLYAAINYIKKPDVKIITIEDPVEYRLEGITQTEVNEDDNYNFEEGLKSILRQDPNAILIGELRDIDSVEAALQGSLAGTKIFSTLHALDAAGATPRLVDMGADPTTIASALLVSIAQRLVRRLCPECKQKVILDKDTTSLFVKILKNLPKEAGDPKLKDGMAIYEAKKEGCSNCGGTGYNGRIAIFEIMDATKPIKEKILKNPSEDEIRDFAIKQGMATMKQDAIIKILEGVTSIKEAERVLGEL